jgi:hypothetical protein
MLPSLVHVPCSTRLRCTVSNGTVHVSQFNGVDGEPLHDHRVPGFRRGLSPLVKAIVKSLRLFYLALGNLDAFRESLVGVFAEHPLSVRQRADQVTKFQRNRAPRYTSFAQLDEWLESDSCQPGLWCRHIHASAENGEVVLFTSELLCDYVRERLASTTAANVVFASDMVFT